MKKIVIVVEGHTELIFVRHILTLIFGWDKISFECSEMVSNNFRPVEFAFPNENAFLFFNIISANNDSQVLATIRNREKNLDENFDRIIGLRDMYSTDYKRFSKNKISDEISLKFIEGVIETIQTLESRDKIGFYFSIMEIEAWVLAITDIFINDKIGVSIERIKNELGIDLNSVDSEKEFFHPAAFLESVYQLAGKPYDKSKGDIESLVSKIEASHLESLSASPKCTSFTGFYEELKGLV